IQKTWVTRKVLHISSVFKRAYLLNRDKVLHLDIEQLPATTHRLVPHPYAAIFKDLKAKAIEILNKNLYFSSNKEKQEAYLSMADLDIVEAHVLTTISDQAKQLEKHLFIL